MATALTTMAMREVAAAAPEALDAEFLDYLAACENPNDNWTVVADEKLRRKAAEKAKAASPPPPEKSAKHEEARP